MFVHILALFRFFVGLVSFAALAEFVQFQTYFHLWIASGAVVIASAFGAFHASDGFLRHIFFRGVFLEKQQRRAKLDGAGDRI